VTTTLQRLADGRHADPEAYTGLAVLIGDAALESDESSLIAGRRGLQRVFARRFADAEQDSSEERGRVLTMIDIVDWMLRRLTPIASLAALRRGTLERQLLELLGDEGEVSDREAAEILAAEESAAVHAGLGLQRLGTARARTTGGVRTWQITPRGRDALLIRLNLRWDSRGVRNAARQILEPDQHEGPQTRRRPVTSGIVAALLMAERPLTIDELADETRHTTSRVRLGVHALIDRGVLCKAGVDRYAVQDDRYCVIGVEVLPGRLVGIVADLMGEPLRSDEQALVDMRVGTVVDGVAELVSRLREPDLDSTSLPPRLLGLGIEIGGHVDGTTGNVVLAPNVQVEGEAWRNVALGTILRDRTGLRTVVENDANALATYQQLFGRLTEETENLAVVTMGDGIGAGLIANGEIIQGAGGLAGEIGHLIIDPGGPLCGCGHYGCIEAYAAVPKIIAATRAESLRDAAARAETDVEALAVFRRAGEALGRGIAALENLLNPSEVLVAVPHELAPADGGRVHVAAQAFAEELLRLATGGAFPTAACQINIRHVPRLAQYGAQGAAAALLRRFVELPLQAIDTETVPQHPSRSGRDEPKTGPVDVEASLVEVVDEALLAAIA
jgi:predicted NBD/HSP70 family sugar kinase